MGQILQQQPPISLSLSAHTTRQARSYHSYHQLFVQSSSPTSKLANHILCFQSRCKKQLVQLRRASTSNHTVAEKSSDFNHWRRKAEIKQLEGRLRILEEEAEMKKGALLESVEECKKIITDIHLHFNTIQNCMLQRELGRGGSYSNAIQIVSHHKVCSHESIPFYLFILCEAHKQLRQGKGIKNEILKQET